MACRFPRTYAEPGRLEQRTGPVGVAELRSLDHNLRGNGAAAKSGIWLEETARGISVKVVQLASGRILLAENIDPQRGERAISAQRVERLRELERRNRGEGITHAFVDIGLYPGQHISGDWVEQWGQNNRQLSGLSVSLFDPVLGIGAAHYWVLPFGESVVGAKLLMSFPRLQLSLLPASPTMKKIHPSLSIRYSTSSRSTECQSVDRTTASQSPLLPMVG